MKINFTKIKEEVWDKPSCQARGQVYNFKALHSIWVQASEQTWDQITNQVWTESRIETKDNEYDI